MTHRDILGFWFEETKPELWFKKDDSFDARIRERFLSTYEEVIADKKSEWRSTPEGRLAEIIVLDQFSRNLFRGMAQAFAGDEEALALAQEAVAAGDDMKVGPERRVFFYMPYMHSESLEVHREALPLFEKLGDKGSLKYEHLHAEIIERFGRYPHRNAALGRESTPDELEFLKSNPGF